MSTAARARPAARTTVLAVLVVVAALVGVPPAQVGLSAATAQDLAEVDLAAAGAREDVVPDEVIVTYDQPAALERTAAAGWRSLGADVDGIRPIGTRVARVRAGEGRLDDVLDRLADDPAVVAVEPNVRRGWAAVPDDTSYPAQWAHQATGAEAAWDIATGRGATAPLIAIVDSGVDATHPDLQGNVVQQLRAADGRVFPAGTAQNEPCGLGHGTAVAGVAAARGDDGFGVAGALWQARIIDVALVSPENGCPGGPADADVIAAIDHLTGLDERPWAINLSLSATQRSCPTAYQAAVDQARAAGILVVAAAGNDGSTGTGVPASCDGVVAVGATTVTDDVASYSQTNPQVDLVAPGGGRSSGACPSGFAALVAEYVVTTSLTDATTPFSSICGSYTDPHGHRLRGIHGTSFAAPYVTAAIGLVRQLAADRGRPLTPDETEALLESTARDAGPVGRDCDFGWGILDLGAATAAVVAGGARPPLAPDPPIGTGTCDGAGELPAYDRLAPGTGVTTDPVRQAVAISRSLPAGSAPYAVLARVDDFADALAGSGLGFARGPLLYTSQTGPLDPATEVELQRVLDVDGRTPFVYVMGGTAAVPAGVDRRLHELGIATVRVAGGAREETAAIAAAEVAHLRSQVSTPTRDHVFVAASRSWPDAVAAGQMAARYGIPLLVTGGEDLHPAARAQLESLRPEQVWVLGGEAVIADDVVAQIGDLGLPVERLAGPTRAETAAAVAAQYREELAADDAGPPSAIGVNLEASWTDVLSASLLGGRGDVFMPLVGPGGDRIVPAVRDGFCSLAEEVVVVGGRDVVSDAAADAAADVVHGRSC